MLLDAATSYGTRLFWPFSDERAGWDWIAIVDPAFTVPLLVASALHLSALAAHEADLLVAVGGGSTLDSSKAVSLILGNAGEFREYQERRVGNEWIPARKVERRGTDLVTVPTTAGTGSEVTEWAGVFDPETGIKGWVGDAKLRAAVVVDDPELTISVPARVRPESITDWCCSSGFVSGAASRMLQPPMCMCAQESSTARKAASTALRGS